MLKAIIFDMDGVLVDSVDAAWATCAAVLNEDNANVVFSHDYIKAGLSRSLRDNLILWQKDFGIKQYDLEEFSRKSGARQIELLKNAKPDPDLVRLLDQAKTAGIKCAVATSSLRWRADAILDILKIKDYFTAVITADDVKNHKPSPDVFLAAAKALDVDPAECVVLEDAQNGVTAAQTGGMKAVGLVTKYYSAEELNQADLVINDFSDINLEKIKELF